MLLTQDDIRKHYETEWKQRSDAQASSRPGAPADALAYSNPVEDAIVYPLYEQLIEDLGIRVSGGCVLDVGSGSGRWVRFFLERFIPEGLVGIDYTAASIELLNKARASLPIQSGTSVDFLLADITNPAMAESAEFGRMFDLINVANVLFHIPEQDKFTRALANLAKLVRPGGHIVTTEYLPRATMRTPWMSVRSRYEFEAACAAAGLRVTAVRAFGFFSNDPMGLDGPDQAVRGHFHKARAGINGLLNAKLDPPSRQYLVNLLADIERATLAFARERIAEIDMPSQKLVALMRK